MVWWPILVLTVVWWPVLVLTVVWWPVLMLTVVWWPVLVLTVLWWPVLVRRGGDGRAQLVLLDHGLYQPLTETVRTALANLWRAIVLNDHPGMARFSSQLGVTGGSAGPPGL